MKRLICWWRGFHDRKLKVYMVSHGVGAVHLWECSVCGKAWPVSDDEIAAMSAWHAMTGE
jgi:hypothetical protein